MNEKEFPCELFFFDDDVTAPQRKSDLNSYFDKHFKYHLL